MLLYACVLQRGRASSFADKTIAFNVWCVCAFQQGQVGVSSEKIRLYENHQQYNDSMLNLTLCKRCLHRRTFSKLNKAVGELLAARVTF